MPGEDKPVFKSMVRRPYQVEAVEITKQNIAQIAPLIGELRNGDTKNPFIAVDPRVVPRVTRAYPGFWLTRTNDSYRCFVGKVFRGLFMDWAPIIAFDFMNMSAEEKVDILQPVLEQLQEEVEQAIAEAGEELTEEAEAEPQGAVDSVVEDMENEVEDGVPDDQPGD